MRRGLAAELAPAARVAVAVLSSCRSSSSGRRRSRSARAARARASSGSASALAFDVATASRRAPPARRRPRRSPAGQVVVSRSATPRRRRGRSRPAPPPPDRPGPRRAAPEKPSGDRRPDQRIQLLERALGQSAATSAWFIDLAIARRESTSTPSRSKRTRAHSPLSLREPRRAGRRTSAAVELARLPARLRRDRARDDAVLVALDRREHRLHELLAEVVRLEPEVEQLGVDRVVVVLLELDARVREVLDRDLVARAARRRAWPARRAPSP